MRRELRAVINLHVLFQARSWASLASVVFLGVLLGALALVQMYASFAYASQYEGALVSGGNVVVVSGREPGEIYARECENLSHRSDVVHSGSVARNGTRKFTSSPGESFQVVRTTPGFMDLTVDGQVWPSASTDPGVLLGRGAAEDLGSGPGSLLGAVKDGSTLPVIGVVSADRRAPEHARWVYEVGAASGRADECWVESTPRMRESLVATVAASMPSLGASIQISTLRAETPEDAPDATLGKVLALCRPVGIGLAAALGMVFYLASSRGYVLMRALGLNRWQQMLLASFRAWVSSGVALAFAGIASGVWVWWNSAGVDVLLSGIALQFLVVSVYLLASAIMPMLYRRQNVVESLRDG